jgi:hypothetical protein
VHITICSIIKLGLKGISSGEQATVIGSAVQGVVEVSYIGLCGSSNLFVQFGTLESTPSLPAKERAQSQAFSAL